MQTPIARTSFLKSTDWQEFDATYPHAANFLLARSLRGERDRLRSLIFQEIPLTKQQRQRLDELEALDLEKTGITTPDTEKA